ncbi:hypothetical protein BDV19DRAFT_379780 [Aspergillus venezuelensis]
MQNLYPGEVLDTVAGFPTIYHFQAACDHDGPSKPLIVCVPGALHLARVFYGGHQGSKPQNFLSHWMAKNGYPVLSVSFPLESSPSLMSPTAKNFRIKDWGQQAAITAKRIIKEKTLSTQSVVLISWSMGGRMVVPFNIAAKELGLDVQQYISFAATPGFSSIRPPSAALASTDSGYFMVSSRVESFYDHLIEMQNLNGGREIIPRDIYLREYVGATPINLIGLGLKYDGKGGFLPDEIPHEQDSQVLNIANLPFISSLYPTSVLDASHCLGDRATWGFLLTYKLEAMIGKKGVSKAQENGNWQALADLIHSAPARMCLPVAGNHFFFVGEKCAREVSGMVEKLIGEASSLKQELFTLVA